MSLFAFVHLSVVSLSFYSAAACLFPVFLSDGIATQWPVVFFLLSFLGVR